jgi:Recombination endonuclease VII
MATKSKRKKWRCKPCHKKFGTDYAKFLRHRRKHHSEAVAKGHAATQRNQYGQTSEEYHAQLEKQHNRCAACPRKATNVGLHQDHKHKIAKLKIINEKVGEWWVARNEEYGYTYRSHTRKKAKRMVLLKLKRRSRRGILCWQCNAALKKLQDNWKIARAISKYLKYWDEKQGWDSINEERMHGNK